MDDIFYPLHSFKEQFSFEPVILNKERLFVKKHIVICGMGGSAISVSLLSTLYPDLSITLHNDYGLPKNIDRENTFIILNSYSGNTEETLDGITEAIEKNISLASISCGGELLSKAQVLGFPHIILPSIGIEPRFAIGHQILAILTLLGEKRKIEFLKDAIEKCDIEKTDRNGKDLSAALLGKYGVLYASRNLFSVAYLIKAAINEGSKVPCFANVISEANHNEIQSFISHDTKRETKNFTFVMLHSSSDNVRITKRFNIMTQLYTDEGFSITNFKINHTNHTQIFELLLTGYFAATYLALARGEDCYRTPFIQEFKKRMEQQ